MDIFGLAFYAVICGVLSLLAPNLGSARRRMGVGAAVGICAAAILPVLKGLMG